MQEVFEKIKERLEEEVKYQNEQEEIEPPFCELTFSEARRKMAECYEHAIEIINQVAEEYSSSEKPNMSEKPTSSNDGWIPCSERLPTDGEVHECTAQFSTGMLYIEYSYYDIAREEWWVHDDTGLVNVIAWREHPAPYQPKGE